MIGIYIIKCNCNGKVYIGQSIDIKKRISEHKSALRHSRHSNSYLQNAFNKYGEKEFSFDILREISPQEYTKQYLDSLEIYYIDLYKSNIINDGFNIESGGNGVGRASEETRKKLSVAMKGKFVGRKLNEQTKLLMSQNSARYWLGKHHSEETKKKLSEQRKGKPSYLKGKKQSQLHIDKKINSQIGRIWVFKGNDSRFVDKALAEQLLKEGYFKGRPYAKRIKGKKYEYDGGLYTIPQISEMCKIDKTIIFARLRKGWKFEDAISVPITSPKTNIGKYLYNGEYLKLTHICKLLNIDYEVLRSRLRRGMSLEEAIGKPIKERNK